MEKPGNFRALRVSRRSAILSGGALAAVVGFGAAPTAVLADPDTSGTSYERYVPGPGIWAPIRSDEAGDIIMRAVRRFHYEIAELSDGDVATIHQYPGQPQSSYFGLLKRHMAVYISPGKYPVGVKGVFGHTK